MAVNRERADQVVAAALAEPSRRTGVPVILHGMSLLTPWRERKRKVAAAAHPVDGNAWSRLERKSPCLRRLAEADRRRLKELAAAFLQEKIFIEAVPKRDGSYEYSGGEAISGRTRLAIAAFACLPVLRLGLDAIFSLKTVIVAPDGYQLIRLDDDGSGVVSEYFEDVAGDSSDYGPVTVSARDVDLSGRGDRYNVVIHEVAHRLDSCSGECDGTPLLPREISREEWNGAFAPSYEDACARARLDASHSGRKHRGRESSLIDPYAAESPEEFFAVCVEYFFDDPGALYGAYPKVYDLLARWLGQDPAGR